MRRPRSTAVPQRPFGQVPLGIAPVEVISADQVEAIHTAALKLLAGTGLKVLHPPARAFYAAAGAQVAGDMVRLDPDLVMDLMSSVPATFTLAARNPANSLRFGGRDMVFTSVGGPAYVMDLDGGRRDGTMAEVCEFLKLIQGINVIHQEGGGPFEPMDLPAATRHLDLYLAQITYLDKSWQTQTLGHARTMDGIEMAAIMFGCAPDALPVSLLGIINTNSPLQLDVPMAEGLIAMASHGQVNVITPFTLAGAMAPVSIAGALVLQHAEAMAGICLTQIVKKGVPVMYGGFTSNVDMRSGAPAFGTPEYAKAAQASGQLARRIGVPFRPSNVTSANAVDAQAAYESANSLNMALLSGVNFMLHACGWLEGGLVSSYEKFVMDADQLGTLHHLAKGIIMDENGQGMDAIREVGPGGHYLGCEHTQANFKSAFWRSELFDYKPFETWDEEGARDTEALAAERVTKMLGDYQAPALDEGIAEALHDYVARKKASVPDAFI